MSRFRVYIAAASSDVERVRAWEVACKAVEIDVVSTWPDVIAKVGQANPREASKAQRQAWALNDLAEVDQANVLWLMCPPLGVDAPARGAYYEHAHARRLHRHIIASGDTLQSIFTALGEEYEHDRDAFARICELAGKDAARG